MKVITISFIKNKEMISEGARVIAKSEKTGMLYLIFAEDSDNVVVVSTREKSLI